MPPIVSHTADEHPEAVRVAELVEHLDRLVCAAATSAGRRTGRGRRATRWRSTPRRSGRVLAVPFEASCIHPRFVFSLSRAPASVKRGARRGFGMLRARWSSISRNEVSTDRRSPRLELARTLRPEIPLLPLLHEARDRARGELRQPRPRAHPEQRAERALPRGLRLLLAVRDPGRAAAPVPVEAAGRARRRGRSARYAAGAFRYCMVASGRGPTDRQVDYLCDAGARDPRRGAGAHLRVGRPARPAEGAAPEGRRRRPAEPQPQHQRASLPRDLHRRTPTRIGSRPCAPRARAGSSSAAG